MKEQFSEPPNVLKWQFLNPSNTWNCFHGKFEWKELKGIQKLPFEQVERLWKLIFQTFLHFRMTEIHPNHKFRAPEMAKMAFFLLLTSHKLIWRKIWVTDICWIFYTVFTLLWLKAKCRSNEILSLWGLLHSGHKNGTQDGSIGNNWSLKWFKVWFLMFAAFSPV